MPSIAQLERLLAVDPHDAFVLYGLAQEYAKAGQDTRAIEFYDRCLAADPTYCYAYYHKARVQADAGQTAPALATIQAGIAVARKAADATALSELQALQFELE